MVRQNILLLGILLVFSLGFVSAATIPTINFPANGTYTSVVLQVTCPAGENATILASKNPADILDKYFRHDSANETISYDDSVHTCHDSLTGTDYDCPLVSGDTYYFAGVCFDGGGYNLSEIRQITFDTTTTTQAPAPTTTSPPYNGGGGGGTCYRDWTCTEWSACTNGQQIRTCKRDYAKCYMDYKEKPAETQACTITTQPAPAAIQPPAQQEELQVPSPTEGNAQPTQSSGGSPGITGAVTGALGTTGSIVLIIVIVAAVGLAYWLVKKNKMKGKKVESRVKWKEKK